MTKTMMLRNSQIIPARTRHTVTFPDYVISPLKEKVAELEWIIDQKNDEYSRLATIAVGAAAIAFTVGLVIGVLCWN